MLRFRFEVSRLVRRAANVEERRSFSMKALRPFALEQMPEWHSCVHQMASSESAPLSLKDTLALADDASLAAWDTLTLGYPTHNTGSPVLLSEIISLYEPGGVEATCVVPQEGILLAMSALLNAGDHVVAMSPGYGSLTEVARSVGCTVDTWEPEFVNGRFVFETAKFFRLLRRQTSLVVLNVPHNPTGASFSLDDFSQICAMAEAVGARVFCDEMYRGLEHSDKSATLDGAWPGPNSLPSAVELSDTAVVLGGMSKVFGMPGIRLGWLATKDSKVMERVNELKNYTTICPSTPSELLATIGLRAKADILLRSREMVRAGIEEVRAFTMVFRLPFLARDDCFEWTEVMGGTMMLLRLRSGSAERYCAYLAKEAGVMLLPSSKFGFGETMLGDSFFRVGYGGQTHLLRAGFEAWAAHHPAALQAAISE